VIIPNVFGSKSVLKQNEYDFFNNMEDKELKVGVLKQSNMGAFFESPLGNIGFLYEFAARAKEEFSIDFEFTEVDTFTDAIEMEIRGDIDLFYGVRDLDNKSATFFLLSKFESRRLLFSL